MTYGLLARVVRSGFVEGGRRGCAVALPDGRAVAVKVADGADRARVQALVALPRRLGVEGGVDGVDSAALEALAHVPVLGHGREVGLVEVAF